MSLGPFSSHRAGSPAVPEQLRAESYSMDERIGRGATGEVYRGHRDRDGQVVAIKVLRNELAADTTVVARFLQEKTILRAVEHPGLVRFLDLVTTEDHVAVVMELMPGGSLRSLLREEGRLSPAAAAATVVSVLQALEALHAVGITHRDVKPENILLGETPDVVKLADFGIAHVIGGQALTRLSEIIGTPEYLAPEVVEGKGHGASADIFATGALLYELVTGASPFAAPHPAAVLRRITDGEVDAVQGLPPGMNDLIAQMLAKQPSSRPSAAEAGAALGALLPGLSDMPLSASSPAALPVGQPVEDSMTLGTPLHRKRQTPEPDVVPTPPARRSKLLLAVPVAVLGLLAGGLVLLRDEDKPAATAQVDFANAGSTQDLKVTRAWTPRSGILHVRLDLDSHRQTDFAEPVPGALAATAVAVTKGPAEVVSLPGQRVVLVHLGGSGAVAAEFDIATAAAPSVLDRARATHAALVSGGYGSKVERDLRVVALAAKPAAFRLHVGEALPVVADVTLSLPGTLIHSPLAELSVEDPTIGALANGLVRGRKVGHTALVISRGPLRRRYPVDVVAGSARPAAIVGLTVTPNVLSLVVGGSGRLTAEALVSDGSHRINAPVTWSAADPSIASVTGGLVSGRSPGTTAVTARSGNATTVASVVVTGVSKPVQGGTTGTVAPPPVAAVNKPPVIGTLASRTSDEGASGAFSIQASDPEGKPLSYRVTGLPRGLSASGNHVTGSIRYDASTATSDWHDLRSSAFTVSVSVSDGHSSVRKTFTWNVRDTQRLMPNYYGKFGCNGQSACGGNAETVPAVSTVSDPDFTCTHSGAYTDSRIVAQSVAANTVIKWGVHVVYTYGETASQCP